MFDQPTFSFQHLEKLIRSCSKADLVLLFVFSTGLILILYGFSLIILNSNKNILVSASESEAIVVSNTTTPQVVVEVAGAVTTPGIYPLSLGSRVGQALDVAGNILESADSTYISKQLNLAQAVSDGDKIYIPFYDENTGKVKSPNNSASESNEGNIDSENTDSTRVSINEATKAELIELPGIGDKRADLIIESRPYQSLTQLIEKEILTQNIFNEVEKMIGL